MSLLNSGQNHWSTSTAAVLRQLVVAILPGIEQPFPVIVFPFAGADSDHICAVHVADNKRILRSGNL